jgi:hypothetical protein
MKRATLHVGVLSLLAVSVLSDAGPAAAADAPKLDLPKGWQTEDVPYPPPWARQLPWRGDVQIRFPPGWFDAKSPFFWSYPVLYWLEGDVLASRDDLEKALRSYDGGLYRNGFDAAKIKIDMGEDRKEEARGHAIVRRSIKIDGFDPFTTRQPLTTHLEVFRWYCPDAQRTAVLILRSPHLLQANDPDAVWKALLPFRETFSCHQANNGADAASRPPEGFEAVFNGRNLTGWEGSPNYWSVEDGCLTGTADGSLKYNRFIVWRGGSLRNFELQVQVKVTPGGNSGLQYRGTERPDLGESVVTGYQCDVVANRPDYNGMLYEERGRRILAHTGERVVIDPDGQPWVVGEFPLQSLPAGQWHQYRVLAEGNHYRHWIDGQPTVDVIDLDEKGRKLEGLLAVQVHVGPPMKIQYRGVFIKRLPDDLPLLSGDQAKIPPDARKVVPQGKDKPRVPGAG